MKIVILIFLLSFSASLYANNYKTLNVKLYPFHAKGDGIQDDTASIQKALDYNATNKVIFFPKGVYRIKGSLKIQSNTTIIGDSREGTIIRSDESIYKDMLILDTVKNITITNLTVDGGMTKEVFQEQQNIYYKRTVLKQANLPMLNTDPSNRFAGIRIYQSKIKYPGGFSTYEEASNYLANPSEFKNLSNISLINIGCRGTIHGEIQIEGVRACIVIEHATNVTMDKLRVYENVGTGVLIRGGELINLRYSELYDNTSGSGISGSGYSKVNITNNYAHHNGYTNISVNGKDSYVISNRSANSIFAGITIGHNNPTSVADNTICKGNIIYNNRLAGISVSNSSNLIIKSNRIYGNEGNGIRFHWSSTADATKGNNLVESNEIYKNNGSGIRVEWGKNNRIFKNNFYHNIGTELVIMNEDSSTSNNVVELNSFERKYSSSSKPWHSSVKTINTKAFIQKNVFVKPSNDSSSAILAEKNGVAIHKENTYSGYTNAQKFKEYTGGKITEE